MSSESPNGFEVSIVVTESGSQKAVILARETHNHVEIDTAELMRIVKDHRITALEIAGVSLEITHQRATNIGISVARSGVGTPLALTILKKGLVDQVLHVVDGEIFLDRGKDAIPGAPLLRLYPLPHQKGGHDRPKGR